MTKFVEETARKFTPFNMNVNIRFTEWMCLLSVYFPYTYVNIWCLLLWNPKDEWIKLDRYKVFPVFSPRTLGWFLVGCRLCTKSYIDIEIRNYVPYIAFTHIKPPHWCVINRFSAYRPQSNYRDCWIMNKNPIFTEEMNWFNVILCLYCQILEKSRTFKSYFHHHAELCSKIFIH